MSHTIQKPFDGLLTLFFVTIIDYAAGGESVLPSELARVDADAVVFQMVNPGQNSLGKFLIPAFSAGKIILIEQNAAGALVEIPSTVGLNARVAALVHSNGS